MLNRVIILIFLAIFWYVLSWQNQPFFVVAGGLSVLFAFYLANRLRLHKKLAVNKNIFAYWLWLAGQVVLSGLCVLKRIWTGKINPAFKELDVGKKTDIWHAIFANSVTLTPGTVAVLIEEAKGKVTIHELYKGEEEDFAAMAKKVDEVTK
jgi:multicomponent Na+:H+ antiporter subunit E